MSQSTIPPIPATYPLTGDHREERFHDHADTAARRYIRSRLQAAGIDYRGHYHDVDGLSQGLYAGVLHLTLFNVVALARDVAPGRPPVPLSLPRDSGAGHQTF